MATLWITEYASMTRDGKGSVAPVPLEPRVTDQVVTFTTATSSADFNQETTILRLLADADFHLSVDTTSAATTTDPKYKANTEYFIGLLQEHVIAAAGLELSVYDGSST